MRCLLIAALCLLASCAAVPSIGSKTSTPESAIESVVRLRIDGRAHCTAVLISPDTLLTAGHCLVRQGFYSVEIDGRHLPVIEKSRIGGEGLRDDIGIIKIPVPVTIRPEKISFQPWKAEMYSLPLHLVAWSQYGYHDTKGVPAIGGLADTDLLIWSADNGAIIPGNSGGAVFTGYGENRRLVGIIVVMFKDMARRDRFLISAATRLDLHKEWINEQLDLSTDRSTVNP